MAQRPPQHTETPIDIEEHEGETRSKVWVRRFLFGLVIVLCVSFAAPTFGSCSGALGTGGQKVWGRFSVGGREVEVHEDDFRRVQTRLAAALRLFAPDAKVEDDQVWGQILLDAAAKAEGVHVSDEQVVRFLAEHPAFQTDGKFDESRYRTEIRQLAKYTGVDHEGFTSALKSLLRTEIYRSVYASAFSVPQSREAYEEWKKTNVKLTVDFVVQPYAALRERAAGLPVTDEDLRRAAILPEILKMRTVPARRGLEAAYLRARDVTAEQRAAMEEFVKANSLLPKDESLEALSWNAFWSNRQAGGTYTREAWAAWKRVEHQRAMADWEKLPEPRPEKPRDASAEPWPEKPADQFYKHWYDFVAKELLAREVVRHLALRAERESKSFAELAPDYARFGVKVVATPEPFSEADITSRFPDDLGRDSELEQAVRTRFRAPAADRTFAPEVLTDPVPATRLVDHPQDRGWIVARWTSWEPARERDVFEVRAQAEAYYRTYRANEIARDTLEAVRKKVDESGTDLATRQKSLRAAAAEAGLEVRTIRRFNARTERPQPPVIAGDATPEQQAAAERMSWRNRVQDDYPVLSKLEPGKLRDPVYLDDSVGAAFLELLVEKHEPEPQEMDDNTLRSERYVRMFQARRAMNDALSPKELKKRFRLELTEDGRKATEHVEKTEG
jgi:hypothetical protein